MFTTFEKISTVDIYIFVKIKRNNYTRIIRDEFINVQFILNIFVYVSYVYYKKSTSKYFNIIILLFYINPRTIIGNKITRGCFLQFSDGKHCQRPKRNLVTRPNFSWQIFWRIFLPIFVDVMAVFLMPIFKMPI